MPTIEPEDDISPAYLIRRREEDRQAVLDRLLRSLDEEEPGETAVEEPQHVAGVAKAGEARASEAEAGPLRPRPGSAIDELIKRLGGEVEEGAKAGAKGAAEDVEGEGIRISPCSDELQSALQNSPSIRPSALR